VCRRRERRGRRGVEDGGLCTLIKTLVKDSKGKGRGAKEGICFWGCSAVSHRVFGGAVQ